MLECSLLHSLKRPNDWQDWLAAAGVPSSPMHESLTFGNSSLAYQAAADGLGIAMGHTVLVADDLQSGRLVAMHALVVRTAEAYHLVSRDGDSRPEVVAFRNWILRKKSGSAYLEASVSRTARGGRPGSSSGARASSSA